jgi:hypothetical protein
MSITRLKSSSEVSVNALARNTPALFTRMSICPWGVERVRDNPLPLLLAGDVVGKRPHARAPAQLISNTLHAVLVGIREHQQSALLRQSRSSRRANTPGRTRNDRHLPLQPSL